MIVNVERFDFACSEFYRNFSCDSNNSRFFNFSIEITHIRKGFYCSSDTQCFASTKTQHNRNTIILQFHNFRYVCCFFFFLLHPMTLPIRLRILHQKYSNKVYKMNSIRIIIFLWMLTFLCSVEYRINWRRNFWHDLHIQFNVKVPSVSVAYINTNRNGGKFPMFISPQIWWCCRFENGILFRQLISLSLNRIHMIFGILIGTSKEHRLIFRDESFSRVSKTFFIHSPQRN